MKPAQTTKPLETRPFTSYREMLPLLRSGREEDHDLFASRIARTAPNDAYRMLHAVLEPPCGLFFGCMIVQIFLQVYVGFGEILGDTHSTALAEKLRGVFLLLALGSLAWSLYRHRGTRSAVWYMARLNEPKAVPLLIKYLKRVPRTRKQVAFHQQCCIELVRLLDDLTDEQRTTIVTEPIRHFFERQFFFRLYRKRRPINDAHLDMLIAVLRFLMKQPTIMDGILIKRILSAPLPPENCANASAIELIREITESHLTRDKVVLKPFTPLPARPQPSPLHIVVGRIGWLEWD